MNAPSWSAVAMPIDRTTHTAVVQAASASTIGRRQLDPWYTA